MRIEGLDSKYTDTGLYLVAFIDVLGVKNKAKKDIVDTLGDLWLINHFLAKAKYENKELIVKSFSDNYLLAVKTSEETFTDHFNQMGNIVGGLLNNCLRVYNILLRGAIVLGNLHIDDNTVLGEALIKAYKLESEVAIYPRVIIDKDIIKIKSGSYTSYNLKAGLFQDFDLQWCLNPLKYCNEKLEKPFQQHLVRNLVIQLTEAEKTKDARVVGKIKWLINYVNAYYLQNYGDSLIDLDNLKIDES